MEKNPLTDLRSINKTLIDKFNASALHKLIKREGLLACIRNNAIGLYYNSDRVAKVSISEGNLKCEVSSYYLSDFHSTGVQKKSKTVYVQEEVIVNNIETIILNSKKRETPEKKAQQHLIHLNNSNTDSEWFCFDIEYRQSTKKQEDAVLFEGRFDILAISKAAPHRVAVIELKYGNKAIPGESGIVKHIKDFVDFNNSASCKRNLFKEIPAMLENLSAIGYDVPPQLTAGCIEISNHIEYYVICLYEDETTRGTVGGYLFDSKRPNWPTKRISNDNNAVSKLGIDVESPTCPIDITFLFKKVNSPNDIDITDILGTQNYDK